MLVKVKKPSKINKFIKLGLSECTINYLGTIYPELEKAFANQRKEMEAIKKQYRNELEIERLYERHGGVEKVSEYDFIRIVDAMYDMAHNPIVKYGKAKVFANLPLLEYAEICGVKLGNQSNENSLNVEDVVQKLYESHGGIGKVPEFNFDEISDAIYTIMNYIGGKGHRQTIKEKEAEKEIEAFFEKLIKINCIS